MGKPRAKPILCLDGEYSYSLVVSLAFGLVPTPDPHVASELLVGLWHVVAAHVAAFARRVDLVARPPHDNVPPQPDGRRETIRACPC